MTLCRAALLSTLVLFPAGLLAQPSPSLTFEPAAVVASGVTPKGKVVWFSVAREIADYAATVVRRDEVVEDEDGDGKVRLEVGRPVPVQSVWIAVDLASGAFAVAVPEGSRVSEIPQPGRNPGRGEPGKPAWVETDRRYLELAVVRPSVGAWAFTLADGGPDDEDGAADGSLTASLARMRGLGVSPAAPDRLSPRDVVAVVDPNRMQYYVETLAPPKP
jgi:hypothetical protein